MTTSVGTPFDTHSKFSFQLFPGVKLCKSARATAESCESSRRPQQPTCPRYSARGTAPRMQLRHFLAMQISSYRASNADTSAKSPHRRDSHCCRAAEESTCARLSLIREFRCYKLLDARVRTRTINLECSCCKLLTGSFWVDVPAAFSKGRKYLLTCQGAPGGSAVPASVSLSLWRRRVPLLNIVLPEAKRESRGRVFSTGPGRSGARFGGKREVKLESQHFQPGCGVATAVRGEGRGSRLCVIILNIKKREAWRPSMQGKQGIGLIWVGGGTRVQGA